MNQLRRIVCAFIAIALSCIMLTACERTLSGTYSSDEGYFIEFTSGDACKMFTEKNDRFAEGKYYWNEKDKCYYLEFSNLWIGSERYKAEISGKELTVTFNSKEITFIKE